MKNKKFWVSLIAGIMAGLMLLTLLLSLLPTKANAASSSEIKSQIEELEEKQQELENKIEALQGQQSDNVTEIRAILEQKNLIDQQVGLLYAQINNLNEQISAYSVLIADKQEELDAAEKRLKDLNEKNKERIRAMEEDGQLSYWQVLFGANSFFDFLDRLSIVEEIAAADHQRLKEMSEAAKQVETARAELLAERDELKKAKDKMDQTQADLEQKNTQAQALLTELIAKGEEYEALMEQLEDEQREAADELANKQVEYDDAKYAEYMATATQPTTQPPSYGGGGGNGGAPVDIDGITWVVPCDYTVVSSPWGWRPHPLSGEWKFHNGVDLWAPGCYGQPIYATRSGVVTYSDWYGSGGQTVMIDHLDGFKSIYMHLSSYAVSEGDFVAAGQIIGYIGTTGGVTGPHLHFEIRYNGETLNPMQFIT
ncbi:MAG: peptidoglycan DD-metalloendopeptidase family protein [Firmicutes bacterium]|nr:peptidoglycan DD-metalloendopeptidase family protein [Bacillota bacterium]